MSEQSFIENIAKVCHQANKAYCEGLSDDSQPDWDKAEQWRRDSSITAVRFAMDNPTAPNSAQHDAWMADRLAAGWVYGEVKDTDAKVHPCLVPYDQLPVTQQKKDALFKAIVEALI